VREIEIDSDRANVGRSRIAGIVTIRRGARGRNIRKPGGTKIAANLASPRHARSFATARTLATIEGTSPNLLAVPELWTSRLVLRHMITIKKPAHCSLHQ